VKILVTAKRVTDPDMKIKVKPDGTGIVTDGMTYKVNPFDEIAVEEALRLKEKGTGAEVVVLGMGGKDSASIIRGALAMGADRGIHILLDTEVDSSVIAEIIQKIVEREQPDLILMGKQAVDDDANQAGQMLAGFLGLPQACFASKVELQAGGKSALVTREIDGGLETLEVRLPAVLTADLRLNEPRYATVMGIMKAKKKPFEEIAGASLGIALTPRARVVRLSAPSSRTAGIKVPDVPTLLQKLKDEAKVL
jgi:electron transfer flavoprotein beta subunit